jgi:hypothetical protein
MTPFTGNEGSGAPSFARCWRRVGYHGSQTTRLSRVISSVVVRWGQCQGVVRLHRGSLAFGYCPEEPDWNDPDWQRDSLSFHTPPLRPSAAPHFR